MRRGFQGGIAITRRALRLVSEQQVRSMEPLLLEAQLIHL
jgi:hypothetical protein